MPAGVQPNVYSLMTPEDPGFIFALRPIGLSSVPQFVNVASFFTSVGDLGIALRGELAEAIREVVENVARTLSELLSAYEKLFGATRG